MIRRGLVLVSMLVACGAPLTEPPDAGGTAGGGASAGGSEIGSDSGVDAGAEHDGGFDAGMVIVPDGGVMCPAGVTCVESFPFTQNNDTSTSGAQLLNGYSCAPNTNESGPERLYRVTVPVAG